MIDGRFDIDVDVDVDDVDADDDFEVVRERRIVPGSRATSYARRTSLRREREETEKKKSIIFFLSWLICVRLSQ